jgi:asparagine N-glycosylation enzyme membrane subunit Stt3
VFLEPTDVTNGGAIDSPAEQRRVDEIVARGPGGAFALAGIAVAIMMAIWVAFYFIVFVARGGD